MWKAEDSRPQCSFHHGWFGLYKGMESYPVTSGFFISHYKDPMEINQSG